MEGDFAICISLYHAFELLQVHGMRSFYQTVSQFLDGPPSRGRSEVINDVQFSNMLRRLRGKLEETDSMDSGSGADSRTPLSQMYAHNVGHSFFYSHPKLRKLEEIVLTHFKNDDSSSSPAQTTFSPSGSLQKGSVSQRDTTRVMIFSQYRESVKEIAMMLSRHSPLVRVMSFVGQASSGKSTKGLTQKEQLQVSIKMYISLPTCYCIHCNFFEGFYFARRNCFLSHCLFSRKIFVLGWLTANFTKFTSLKNNCNWYISTLLTVVILSIGTLLNCGKSIVFTH